MGRGSDLFRYSGMANPDITSGARLLLEGLGTPRDLVDKANVRERVELQDARQARLDALNTPGSAEWIAAKEAEQQLKLGAMSAEQAWKSANDPVYQNALAAAKRETPGTPEWSAAQKLLQELKISGMTAEMDFRKKYDPVYQAQVNALGIAENERKGREALAGAIMGLPTDKITKTTITPEQASAVRTGLESEAVVNAGNVYNREYAKLTKPDTTLDVDATGEVRMIPTTPAMSSEEAHQEALKRAGLLGVVAGQSPNIDESKLPKVGTTEAKTKLTADELTQAKIDATRNLVKEGKVPASVALEVATKLTPVKTQKEKLEEAKFALDIEEFKEKQAKGYYGKGGGSGSGDWLKALNETYKTYGDPDVIGTGDKARIQNDLAKIQIEGKYSDADMKDAIEASMGVYANPGSGGVDELGFVRAVGDNLLKMKSKEKAQSK